MTDVSPPSANTPLPKRRGLGRGLDALFEDTELRVSAPNPDVAADHVAVPAGRGGGAASAAGSPPPMLSGGRIMMPLSNLEPGQYQPRKFFDDGTLYELAQSIAQHGVIQPLLVRPHKVLTGKYEIIAGERRWRAAMKVGVHEVPVVINASLTDREALQLGLIENIQRQDLSAIEEAEGYQRLVTEFGLSPERLGEMVGKSRSHVVNTIRLLQSTDFVRQMVNQKHLTPGHARALIGVPNSDDWAEKIMTQKLSVRQTERLVALQQRPRDDMPGDGKPQESHIVALNKELTDFLGLAVRVLPGQHNGMGQVIIDYHSLDQLDLIIHKLKG